MAIACAPRRFGDRNFVGDPTASAVIIAPGEEVLRPRFHGTFATHGAQGGVLQDGIGDYGTVEQRARLEWLTSFWFVHAFPPVFSDEFTLLLPFGRDREQRASLSAGVF